LDMTNIKTDFLDDVVLGVNEVERFKWREGVLYKIEKNGKLTDDEREAVARYSKLAQILAAGDYEL